MLCFKTHHWQAAEHPNRYIVLLQRTCYYISQQSPLILQSHLVLSPTPPSGAAPDLIAPFTLSYCSWNGLFVWKDHFFLVCFMFCAL